jgi:hypothetical protein
MRKFIFILIGINFFSLSAKCQYQEFILKDNLGTANSNPIVITGTIDGSTTFSINTDYASITLVSNGTEWRAI